MILNVFDFNKVSKSVEEYEYMKSSLKDEIFNSFKSRKSKKMIMIGSETIESTLGGIYLNLILVYPFVKLRIPLKKEYLFLKSNVTQDELEKYMNFVLETCKKEREDVQYNNIRAAIYEVLNEVSDLSGALNTLAGNTLSYTDLLRMSIENPEAYEIFHPTITEGQFNDIERQFDSYGNKLMNIFKQDTECELHPFVVTGTGLNKKQCTQAMSFIGLKPNIDGTVIPVTVKDNFLTGLKSKEAYFINAKGTRLALTTNNKMTKRSGYLTRKLSLSNIDHYHDNNIFDCGTRHFTRYNVDSEKKLRMIIGRHYYDLDEAGEKTGELKTVTSNSKLVGKIIGLRGPETCCGKHVCATCYGRELSEINKNVNTGLVAVLRLTEPLTQMLLSAKHLLSTNTDRIDWGDDFLDVLNVNMDKIYFEDVDANITFRKPITEEWDEDEGAYYTTKLTITQTGSKKGFEFDSPTKLFINPKITTVEKMKDDDEEIQINSRTYDDYIFSYQPKNNELTKSLQQILDLIESNDHLGCKTIDALINKFADLLIENGLNYISLVHIEMIAAVLIKDVHTGKRLDFSKKLLDEYKIDRVSKSVMGAPLAVSMSFERINDQLIDLETYEKDEVSMMDYLFR